MIHTLDGGICTASSAGIFPLDPACPYCLQFGQIDIDSSLVASVDKLADSGQVSLLHQAAPHSCSALHQAIECALDEESRRVRLPSGVQLPAVVQKSVTTAVIAALLHCTAGSGVGLRP